MSAHHVEMDDPIGLASVVLSGYCWHTLGSRWWTSHVCVWVQYLVHYRLTLIKTTAFVSAIVCVLYYHSKLVWTNQVGHAT